MVAILLLTMCGDKNNDYLVTIKTQFGDMKVLLYEETPLHKSNFLQLARDGKYDSTQWHRVIEDFMVQGGDIYARTDEKEKESDRIPAEIVDGFYHTKGALAAARQDTRVNPEKMSSSSQFYIVDGKQFEEREFTIDQMALNRGVSELLQKPEYDSLAERFLALQQEKKYEEMNKLAYECVELVEQELGLDLTRDADPDVIERYTTTAGAPHLDGEYTVFGRVVEGLDVIDKIAAVPVNRNDKPLEPIYLTMEVEKLPKKEITEMYGYEYPAAETQ